MFYLQYNYSTQLISPISFIFSTIRNGSSWLFVAAFLFALPHVAQGQECDNFEKKCPNPPKTYKMSASSRSYSFRKGGKTTITLNAMGGRDYFISVCGSGKVTDVQFRIIGGDTNNRKVLFDNAALGFATEKVISMTSTQKIFIEISAPKTKLEKGETECGGVQIGYKNSR